MNIFIIIGLILMLLNVNSIAVAQIMDADGNIYNTINIGRQTWMVENLKTTRFQNGDPIPNVVNEKTWIDLTTGAYCDYNNNQENGVVYGKLYNWYAVSDKRNICPFGWHVSYDADWIYLLNYLGGTSVSGGKLKEEDTIHWMKPNSGATNKYGFTALPGGHRHFNGYFYFLTNSGNWWTSTESFSNNESALFYYIHYNYTSAFKFSFVKSTGFSVRCVKN